MTEYAIQYLNNDRRWITVATFREPLDAERAYRSYLEMRPTRPVRQVRIFVLADSREGE